MEGMPILKVITSLEKGVGGTLGNLELILGFRAIFGKLSISAIKAINNIFAIQAN
ncbi:hypothetical protein OSC52_17430 [Clostridium pasteurianum]|uniref:GntT/GntP/DsdX family permease n=1 Tax=Clostridium pasteurianum TaxID=1501 RepID=UPI00226101A4|nr:hypothetical protein [Clostridium pasteurianum]UZW16331.1 hypothetical protein OSC52_17430 [Clostridium pasteurianum]